MDKDQISIITNEIKRVGPSSEVKTNNDSNCLYVVYPYYKYFLVKNPFWGIPVEDPTPPSYESWECLRGYEPSKIVDNYEVFRDNYMEREIERRIRSSNTELLVERMVIDSNTKDQVIAETESREDFVRWINS